MTQNPAPQPGPAPAGLLAPVAPAQVRGSQRGGAAGGSLQGTVTSRVVARGRWAVGGYSALHWKPRRWPAACDIVVKAWRASSAPEPSANRLGTFSSGLCDVFKLHLLQGLGSVCSVRYGLAALGCLIRGLGHSSFILNMLSLTKWSTVYFSRFSPSYQ